MIVEIEWPSRKEKDYGKRGWGLTREPRELENSYFDETLHTCRGSK